jgi:NAD(P)-dependent dehydrogenase (short-subunit alcohol dehydrogenase family)
VERLDRLKDRVAVVTGAGRGIGAAIAIALAREGASVVVNDIGASVDGQGADQVPAADVVRQIEADGGQAITSFEDVSDHEAARRIIHGAVDAYGKLDIVVNVAGILRDKMIFNLSEQEWDDVIRVHLRGTFNTTKWASKYWREHRNPDGHYRLINFTSGSGLSGAPAQPNYAAAKMGIVGLTFSCAAALRKYGVTSNAIAPQAATRMTDVIPAERQRADHPEDVDDQWNPENVAMPVLYVASEQSDWLNASVIRSQGYQISLYSNPELVRQLTKPSRWEFDELATLMESSFRPAVEGRPKNPWAKVT